MSATLSGSRSSTAEIGQAAHMSTSTITQVRRAARVWMLTVLAGAVTQHRVRKSARTDC